MLGAGCPFFAPSITNHNVTSLHRHQYHLTDLTTIKRPEMSKEIAHGTNVQLLLIILTNPHPAMCPFTSISNGEISFREAPCNRYLGNAQMPLKTP